MAFMSGINDHIKVDEGNLPKPAGWQDGHIIDVLVSLPLANQLGLQIGENYIVLGKGFTEAGSEISVPYPVQVASMWRTPRTMPTPIGCSAPPA